MLQCVYFLSLNDFVNKKLARNILIPRTIISLQTFFRYASNENILFYRIVSKLEIGRGHKLVTTVLSTNESCVLVACLRMLLLYMRTYCVRVR